MSPTTNGESRSSRNILVFHSTASPNLRITKPVLRSTRPQNLVEKHHESSATELADTILRDVDWFTESARFPMIELW